LWKSHFVCFSEKRQRSARDTQTGAHLLEERRIENVVSRSPFYSQTAQNPKDFSDEDETRVPSKWSADRFNGVMDDMRDHLFETNRPPNPHLANGYADWERFGFGKLAVVAAKRRGDGLVLELSASDPVVTQRGLEKYRCIWNASLLKWFGCEVRLEWQQTPRKS
jgi:hypothetical protein